MVITERSSGFLVAVPGELFVQTEKDQIASQLSISVEDFERHFEVDRSIIISEPRQKKIILDDKQTDYQDEARPSDDYKLRLEMYKVSVSSLVFSLIYSDKSRQYEVIFKEIFDSTVFASDFKTKLDTMIDSLQILNNTILTMLAVKMKEKNKKIHGGN